MKRTNFCLLCVATIVSGASIVSIAQQAPNAPTQQEYRRLELTVRNRLTPQELKEYGRLVRQRQLLQDSIGDRGIEFKEMLRRSELIGDLQEKERDLVLRYTKYQHFYVPGK